MRLNNKVILITGGYTGLGLAIAAYCVKEGAKVVVNGLRKELEPLVVDTLGSEKVHCVTVDITEAKAPDILIQETINKFGKIDALVNNAAKIESSNITTTDTVLMQELLAVNTIAPLALIQAALPYLSKVKGSVLNIGSINAWCGEPDLLGYSISKGALMTLSRNLGDSLFRDYGVRVNQINPGWVLTEKEKLNKKEQGMHEDWYKDLPDIFAPSKRIFSPKEIAAAAIYLLSDESGPVSGQVIELEQFPMIGRNLPKN